MSFSYVGGALNVGVDVTTISVTHDLTISAGDFVCVYLSINSKSPDITPVTNGGADWLLEHRYLPFDETATQFSYSKIANSTEPISFEFTTSISTISWFIQVRVFTPTGTPYVTDVAHRTVPTAFETSSDIVINGDGYVLPADAVALAFGSKSDAPTDYNFTSVDQSFLSLLATDELETEGLVGAGAYRIFSSPTTFSGDVTITADAGSPNVQETFGVFIAYSELSNEPITEETVAGDDDSTNNLTLTFSTQPSEGDLLLVVVYGEGDSFAPGFSMASAGWDTIHSEVSGTNEVKVFAQIAGANPSSSYAISDIFTNSRVAQAVRISNHNVFDVTTDVLADANIYTSGFTSMYAPQISNIPISAISIGYAFFAFSESVTPSTNVYPTGFVENNFYDGSLINMYSRRKYYDTTALYPGQQVFPSNVTGAGITVAIGTGSKPNPAITDVANSGETPGSGTETWTDGSSGNVITGTTLV